MSLVHLLVDWTHLRQATELKMSQQKPPKLKAIRRGGKKKIEKTECIRTVGRLQKVQCVIKIPEGDYLSLKMIVLVTQSCPTLCNPID